MAGNGSNLVTSGAHCSIRATDAGRTAPYLYYTILMNVRPLSYGSSVELELAQHSYPTRRSSDLEWYEWTNSAWAPTSNPISTPLSPPLPPTGHVLTVGPGQQFSTIAAAINASQN